MDRIPRSARLPIGIALALLAVIAGFTLSFFGTTPQTQWMEPLAIVVLLIGCPALAYAIAFAAIRVWRRGGLGLRLLAVPLAALAIPPLLYFIFLFLELAGVIHLF
jgi:hypothetical protein